MSGQPRLRAHLGHGGELVQEGLDGVFVQQRSIRLAALVALRVLLFRRLARGKPAHVAPFSEAQTGKQASLRLLQAAARHAGARCREARR